VVQALNSASGVTSKSAASLTGSNNPERNGAAVAAKATSGKAGRTIALAIATRDGERYQR